VRGRTKRHGEGEVEGLVTGTGKSKAQSGGGSAKPEGKKIF